MPQEKVYRSTLGCPLGSQRVKTLPPYLETLTYAPDSSEVDSIFLPKGSTVVWVMHHDATTRKDPEHFYSRALQVFAPMYTASGKWE